jgi:integrase
MADNLLTDRKCKAAKPRATPYPLNDGKGLRLVVHPNGSKYWVLRYVRLKPDGTTGETTTGLGTYPDVSIGAARNKADEARGVIRAGIKPSVHRKVERARNVERGEATFRAVSEEWLKRNKANWSGHHHERNEGLLRRILWADLGDLPVHEITEPMLLKPLLAAYDSGIRESARRARAVAQQVFRYAKDTHRSTHNPALDLADSRLLEKPKVTHFAAIQAKQVGPMLRALVPSAVDPVTAAALRMMLYTGLRDAALRAARWREIDLRARVWTVPGERMKSGREHRLPLPKQAVAVLSELAKLTRHTPNAFVFEGRGKAGHLAENTLRLALHGMGFKVTAHGFRSLLTDLLNEKGFNPDWIERQLDHVQKDKVRAAYLRTDFFEGRTKMTQWLADWAEAQEAERAAPKLPDNVKPLRRVA